MLPNQRCSRDPCLVDLAVSPQWDLLRADARFGRLVTGMGLVPVSVATAPSKQT